MIKKRCFQIFDIQGFLHDLFACDWDKLVLILDVNSAQQYFHTLFLKVINKHARIKKFLVKGRDNPWFTDELSDLFRERNSAWARARKTGHEKDWVVFRALRNKCIALVCRAKSEFYLNEITRNLNNPTKFWKTIKSLSPTQSSNGFPNQLTINERQITDRTEMVNCFNKHFVGPDEIAPIFFKFAAEVIAMSH